MDLGIIGTSAYLKGVGDVYHDLRDEGQSRFWS